MAKSPIKPLTFFLNETHELSPSEVKGGGRQAKYANISWTEKQERISQSLLNVSKKVAISNDPLKNERFFVLAIPVPEVEKISSDKKKTPKGTYQEPTRFAGLHNNVFDRLGLDLLHVTEEGKAVIHAEKEKFEQIRHRAETLRQSGQKEQSRWMTIDSFEVIPQELRVDDSWLKSLAMDAPSEIIIELQPMLSRLEANRVLHVLADLLAQRSGEKLTGTGTDFSGRHWFRGKASRQSVRNIAKDFYSIQAIHAPLYSLVAAKSSQNLLPKTQTPLKTPISPVETLDMPCVAVVDLGIPRNHSQLQAYRRGQFYGQDAPRNFVGDHGSVVASRIVFGDCKTDTELLSAQAECTFFDASVAADPYLVQNPNSVNDKLVMEALTGTRAAAPDVRVFNLSFGDTRPLSQIRSVERREHLLMLENLDNFVFANDCVVVVAAGNSQAGVSPNSMYPAHYDDPSWKLGPWACGFNTWVCGAYVSTPSASGLVQTVGWPSPFTRIGPGLCDVPIPSFSAPGGNTDETYRSSSGFGVWGLSASGYAEDHIGTSQAAPILSRQAAFTLHELRRFCEPGTAPFAVTARAFLTLTANRPTYDLAVKTLVNRTLGKGQASVDRLRSPASGSAIFLWQGSIESKRDKVRVQLPVPSVWVTEAQKPILRLVVCCDPPVNQAVSDKWACRKIVPRLYVRPEGKSVIAPRGGHTTYSVIDRHYDLRRYKPEMTDNDLWLLELSYEEIASYPRGIDFDPRQRVAFAAELIDEGDSPVDPQLAMQALPILNTMNRLAIQNTPIRAPIVIKNRI